ncbi:NADPH-dependent oxidoreductase [Paenibacillus senegalensis]|uniref:NADPH-dependent oxidoreductase n=1 Tax=Paenibacillus senegalensis TaxID=1465766 RepID=UPI000289C4B8|nr:NADPH-dependent oxidoreductase [Paenibacillus senegalensis]
MNPVIDTLSQHRSIRRFTGQAVSEEQVETIVRAAMAQANWINGQQVTVVEVLDAQDKAEVAAAAGDQKHVKEAPVLLIFCMDFRRAKLAADKQGVELGVVEDIEAVLIGSTDVGLAMGNAITAAESMGLGIVPIGGIRRDPGRVISLLELPEFVFPIAGLVIGYPDEDPGLKPRLPLQAVYHKGRYNPSYENLLEEYDAQIAEYTRTRSNGAASSRWTERTAMFYSEGYLPYAQKVTPALKGQGFALGAKRAEP